MVEVSTGNAINFCAYFFIGIFKISKKIRSVYFFIRSKSIGFDDGLQRLIFRRYSCDYIFVFVLKLSVKSWNNRVKRRTVCRCSVGVCSLKFTVFVGNRNEAEFGIQFL
ncbi:hypothetical protein SDC9_174266 [bioreactor metagenome]|uniref:Uncharacterized protein n=1 Tax=bioreactor metagenome TaxID=1076179 RepID=A0A645GL15_9ZZZZ